MKWLSHASPLLLTSLLLACEDGRPDPLAPSAIRAGKATVLEVTGGMASGHADVSGVPIGSISRFDETISFTARSTGDFPLATGRVEFHGFSIPGLENPSGDKWTVHAEVTCLAIVGNQAWVGARMIRWVYNGEEWLWRRGGPMIFRVVDAGEGADATDQASLAYFPVPSIPGPVADDMSFCNTRPNFPILRTELRGNIQVKPE